ncbi:resolvase-like protein [Rhizobium azibense]|nr:resolvase-like protein [Rhizobium azibense]
MKVAIYARYPPTISGTLPSPTSSASAAFMLKQGWQVVGDHTDHAISGTSLLRPGIQALISDATRGRFQFVLAGAMDRLSRDQEDIAGLYERMVSPPRRSGAQPRFPWR